MTGAEYDRKKWGKTYEHKDIQNLLKEINATGIHTLDLGSYKIDILSEFSHQISDKNVILVGFTGSVSNRNNKTAPFFSGRELAKQLKLPLIAIADPSVTRSKKLQLAWYLGNDLATNLPQDIAILLDAISKKLERKTILFGGSGGGFAAINIGGLMKSKPAIISWGPQTYVPHFAKASVTNYVNEAFPSDSPFKEIQIDQIKTTDISSFLETKKIKQDIRNIETGNLQLLFYLQNLSDSHTKKHAFPFLKGRRIKHAYGNNFHIDDDSKRIIHFGDWGKGHTPPGKDYLISFFEQAQTAICSKEEKNITIPCGGDETVILIEGSTKGFDIIIQTENRTLHAFFITPNLHPTLKFAFYLIHNNEKIATQGYSSKKNFSFELDDITDLKDYKIIGFAIDELGNKKIIRKNLFS